MFLDSQLLLENDFLKTEVYRNGNKFPVHWKSQFQKRNKRYAINGDLNRSWSTSSHFYHEKNEIRSKFLSAGYPMRSVNNVTNDSESKEHDPMIPNFLFNDLNLNQNLLF